MLSRIRTQLPLWRRALRRRRRLLVVLALSALLVAVLPALVPASQRGVTAVVTRTDLPAGTVLTAEHLGTVRVAEELLPPGTPRDVGTVLGRTTRVELGQGAAVLPGALEEPGHPRLPAGSVLMAVPVPAPLVPSLGPGTQLRLHSTDPATGRGEAVAATVVDIVDDGSSGTAVGALGSAPSQAVIAVSSADAGDVAHAMEIGGITVAVTVL